MFYFPLNRFLISVSKGAWFPQPRVYICRSGWPFKSITNTSTVTSLPLLLYNIYYDFITLVRWRHYPFYYDVTIINDTPLLSTMTSLLSTMTPLLSTMTPLLSTMTPLLSTMTSLLSTMTSLLSTMTSLLSTMTSLLSTLTSHDPVKGFGVYTLVTS